jgi:chorismate mutase
MQTTNLDELRQRLDQIDTDLIALLAERFEITAQVGLYKKAHALPPVDEAREAAQFQRIAFLAQTYNLDPTLLHNLFRLIINKVVENHHELQAQ